jgi:hypothetical protein
MKIRSHERTIICTIGAALISGGISSVLACDSGESCYELNKRYGRCIQATNRGESCRPEDDIVMPERCRGGGDSDRGLRDGLYGKEGRDPAKKHTPDSVAKEYGFEDAKDFKEWYDNQ